MSGKTLYLGLTPPQKDDVVHFPVIRIVQHSFDDESVVEMMAQWNAFTHLIFTSKSAVQTVGMYCETYRHDAKDKIGIAVGKATAEEMEQYGFPVALIAEKEQAEGIVEVLDGLNLKDAFVLWPHSSLSRNIISNYLLDRKVKFSDVAVYNTVSVEVSREDAPNLDQFEKIVFTSPSTVEAFTKIYGDVELKAELVPIGPITREALESCARWGEHRDSQRNTEGSEMFVK